MRNRAFASSKRYAAVVCAVLTVSVCGAFTKTSAAPQLSPTLFSVSSTSTRAVVLESVSMKAEPFSLNSAGFFNANDPRTRITLFCMNLDLLSGEAANSLTADAEDAAHVHYPLKVEYVGSVPGLVDGNGQPTNSIYMVVLRLNDLMTSNLGDVLIRLNLHGMGSNRVRVAIGQIGGGPADDNPGVGTPAPVSPPPAVTQQTIAQFQAQFSDPSFPSDQDRRRFLEQATWGPTDADLTHLQAVGMQTYLNEQFNTSPSSYPNLPLYPVTPPTPCDATCLRDNYSMYPLQVRFFQNALTGPDQLRQRVAFALHQMIPVSGRDLNNEPSWVGPYLQKMDANAFGNFRDVLFDVTLNPGMGNYLDMSGNSRVAPNENYAREIMQLFSIGVDTLNQDGTPVLDAQGNRVPSYSESTIQNLARVFTGWRITSTNVTINGTIVTVPDYITPMPLQANTNTYDIAAKTLLADINNPNPIVLPACSNCTNLANFQAYKTAELNAAINNLFNHPNTGPYLCTQLIHQLVTSNPSGAYVGRCSAAFANNGSGVRGDMKAVVTAILLDPEARGDVKTDPNYGHLREPVLLMTHLLRNFNATSDFVLASSPFSFTNDLGQDLFNPPTVFSYYPADYGVPGTNLFGPEFGLLNTSTTFRRANFVHTLFIANNGAGILPSAPNRPTGTQTNYSAYQAQAGTPSVLVDMLNTSMMHGTMSQMMKSNIEATVNAIVGSDPAGRTRTAIYLVATSSQYQVER